MHNKMLCKMRSCVKKTATFALTLATAATLLPNIGSYTTSAATVVTPETADRYGYYMEPCKVDANQDGDNEILWSTFTYGMYPQSQVTDEHLVSTLDNLDDSKWTYMENPALSYWEDSVEDYFEWSTFAYTTIGGEKYLRMSVYDTSSATLDPVNGLYQWENDEVFHYYKFEPIKWRVLSVNEDGTDALVISDKVLDSQPFNYTTKIVNGRRPSAWKYSTLRSFLNGYASADNAYGSDYSNGYSFLDMAFTDEQQEAILTSELNNSNGDHAKTYSSPSNDKIFCLAVGDTRSSSYGFSSDRRRIGQTTDYTKQNGAFGVNENVFWWTRSGGDDYSRCSNVDYQGDIHSGGNNADCYFMGVRPAMHLNLTTLNNSAFSGYVDENYNYYANQVIFDLNGTKTYTYTSTNNLVFLPDNYEIAGYNYNYSVSSNTSTTTIQRFPVRTTRNCTINVTREAKENTISVFFKAPSNWSKAYIHYCIGSGKWTTAPGMLMENNSELSGYNYKFVIECSDTTNATVCFTDGKGNWNNNNSKDFKLSKLGVYAINGTSLKTISVAPTATPIVTTVPTATPIVTVAPTATPVVTTAPTATPIVTTAPTATPVVTAAPTETPVSKTITVYYNTGWTTPHIHYSTTTKGWTAVPGVKMTATSEKSGYTYKFVIPVEAATDSATVCFNNGGSSWDNNRGRDYTFTGTGVYGVSNGVIYTLDK